MVVEAFAHSYAIAAWVIIKGRRSGKMGDGLYTKTFLKENLKEWVT